MSELEKKLDEMLEESEKEAEALDDDGHKSLVQDAEQLLERVKSGYYHDFHRNGADAPKIELVNQLQGMVQNVLNGEYDN